MRYHQCYSTSTQSYLAVRTRQMGQIRYDSTLGTGGLSSLASNETSEIRNLEIIFQNIPIEYLSISKCKYASWTADHKVISSKLRMHLPPHHHLSLRIFMFECILTSPRRTSLLLLRIFYLLFMIIFHNYSWWATGCALSAKANPRLTLLLSFNISRSTSRS